MGCIFYFHLREAHRAAQKVKRQVLNGIHLVDCPPTTIANGECGRSFRE